MGRQRTEVARARTIMLYIDGSHGEGGGQILRTALSLSAICTTPITIELIRAGRRNPGLRPQHVTAVRAMASVCGAQVFGATVGSQRLVFEPQHTPRPATCTFDVQDAVSGGSAGSTGLILQTVLLPLAIATGQSSIAVRGGTHVAWSPPFHYLEHVYLPILDRVGIHVQLQLVQWGWYPVGGGEVRALVEGGGPAADDQGDGAEAGGHSRDHCDNPCLEVTERGDLLRIWGVSATSRLPAHIRERMRYTALERLRPTGMRAEIELVDAPSPGPGAGIFLFATYRTSSGDSVTAGFSGFGRRGKPAEVVAEEAANALLAHHRSGAPVDQHLADQLILPLALLGRTARFRTSMVTTHLVTNGWVVSQFLPVHVDVGDATPGDERPATVLLAPTSN